MGRATENITHLIVLRGEMNDTMAVERVRDLPSIAKVDAVLLPNRLHVRDYLLHTVRSKFFVVTGKFVNTLFRQCGVQRKRVPLHLKINTKL